MNRIEANLEGNVTIAGAVTAAFNVEGDAGRVVAVLLEGPGMSDDPAISVIGPSGTFYAANTMSRAFSAFEDLRLSDDWEEPFEYVEGCLAQQ